MQCSVFSGPTSNTMNNSTPHQGHLVPSELSVVPLDDEAAQARCQRNYDVGARSEEAAQMTGSFAVGGTKFQSMHLGLADRGNDVVGLQLPVPTLLPAPSFASISHRVSPGVSCRNVLSSMQWSKHEE